MTRKRIVPSEVATITVRQGAIIFNRSKRVFWTMLRNGLGDKIRSYRTSHERRLVLTDVLKAAFPEANSDTIHNMALNFLVVCRDDRVETYGNNREVKTP